MARRVLLVGAGPAHRGLLQALASGPLRDADVVWLAGAAPIVLPGRVPALVAGRYTLAQCQLDPVPLASAAGVRLVQASVVAVDVGARRVQTSDGRSASYDLLSLDPEAVIDRDLIPGGREQGLFVYPLHHFTRLLDPLLSLAAQRALDIVVVGAGPCGIELALAFQQRLGTESDRPARVALVTGGGEPMGRHPAALQRRVARALAARRITIFREPCAALLPGAVVLTSGARLACDAPVLAIGAQAPRWLAGSGLALDEAGFVAAGATLQSVSHPEVLAVTGLARQAHLLAGNLRRLLAGQAPRSARPAPRALHFVDLGDRRAIVARGDWVAQGRWAGMWKDRIDRA